jgi:hypothetical protein
VPTRLKLHLIEGGPELRQSALLLCRAALSMSSAVELLNENVAKSGANGREEIQVHVAAAQKYIAQAVELLAPVNEEASVGPER